MSTFPFLAGLVLPAALLLTGCARSDKEPDDPHELHTAEAVPATVVHLDRHKVFHAGLQTEPVRRKTLAVPLALTGTVGLDERHFTEIPAPLAGRIEKVHAFTNDRVRAGDVLLELFSQDYLALQNEFVQTAERRSRGRSLATDDVAAAQAVYESSKRKLRTLGVTDEEIAALEDSRVPHTHLRIRAPFSGTIIESKARRGSHVPPGAELYELADLSTLWVLADLYEKDLSLVKPGMTVQVTVTAFGHSSRGTVSSVYGVLDEKSRTVKARVQVDNGRGMLRPGMFCTVHVQTRLDSSTIKIPAGALLGEPRKHFVFVARNDTTFERRDVLTGFEGREVVEVLDGLLAGEMLVTKGGFFLKSELAKETFGEEH
jgi:RND family efflux transporter MFP subunit